MNTQQMRQPPDDEKPRYRKFFGKNAPVFILGDPSGQVYQVKEVLESGRVQLYRMPDGMVMDGTYNPEFLVRYR